MFWGSVLVAKISILSNWYNTCFAGAPGSTCHKSTVNHFVTMQRLHVLAKRLMLSFIHMLAQQSTWYMHAGTCNMLEQVSLLLPRGSGRAGRGWNMVRRVGIGPRMGEIGYVSTDCILSFLLSLIHQHNHWATTALQMPRQQLKTKTSLLKFLFTFGHSRTHHLIYFQIWQPTCLPFHAPIWTAHTPVVHTIAHTAFTLNGLLHLHHHFVQSQQKE